MRHRLANTISRHRTSLTNTAIITVLAGALLVSAAIILTGPLSHDEHMYLSAGRLLEQHSLYADFAYVQAPYMAYVHHWAFELTGSSHLLMIARLLKVVIVSALILIVYGLSVKLTGDRWFAVACVLLLVNNGIFRHAIPYATNLDMATLLTLLAFWVFLTFEFRGRRDFAFAVAGFLAGLAIGTKLTYTLIPLCFLCPIAFEYGVSKRAVYLTCSFIVGLLVALAPAIHISFASGLDVAYFNNLGYHRLNALWREESGSEHVMSFREKLNFAKYQLLALPSALLLLANLFAAFSHFQNTHRLSFKRGPLVFGFVLLVAVSTAMFMIPTPIWRGYLSTFIVSLALLVSVLYSELEPAARRASRTIVWSGVLILLAMNGLSDVRRTRVCFEPDKWTGAKIHRNAVAMKSIIPEDHRTQPVATLCPLFALEADLPIYPELATGPFAYRIGGLLSSDELSRYRTTSARHVVTLMSESPPSAIFVGFSEGLDTPLANYAEGHGYRKYQDVIEDATVYVKPNSRMDTDEE